MALPYYPTPLSISMIRNELGVSSSSLLTLSLMADFSAPYFMSEFYGYSAGPTYTFYGYGYSFDPCEGNYELYEGSDGNWYKSFPGVIDKTLCTGDISFTFGYYDWEFEQFFYIGYILDFGPSLSFWGTISSYCAPPLE